MALQSETALRDIARAKVNLTLRVVGRRTDGFHDLESVVAFADCADGLGFDVAAELSLSATGPRVQECGDAHDNLVLKAARLLAGLVPDLKLGAFTLDKQLPVAAGIGGGSADAAAALRLLARANGIALDDVRLIEAARLTGADVPVCLLSQACVMTGVGETLQPLHLPRLPCVMVNPRRPVATVAVFQELGLTKGSLRAGLRDILSAPAWPKEAAPVAEWIKVLSAGTNDLEAPALRIEPEIGVVLAALREADGVQLARMSGSGATCFAIFSSDAAAMFAGDAIRIAHPDWWVHAGALS